MSIDMVCIADRHHTHLRCPTQLKTWGKEMVQEAVLQKKSDTASLAYAEHEGPTWLFRSRVLLQTVYTDTWGQVLVCLGRSVILCCFLQHPFYGQCWRWDIWLGGPLVWMGMAVLRCLAWTVVQGKCVQHATPHLFSLSQTTFMIVNLPHSETPLLYFAGETCTDPAFLRHLSVLFFPSCFGFPGCIQWWILQVSLLTEPKSQSKTQQSSSITCLTHTGTHQSVMVPLKQISAFSKFDRNFTFVTKKTNPKTQPKKLA